MEDKIHRNFKLASYLIFLAIIIDVVVGVLHSRTTPDFDIATGIETSLMFMTLGYFAFIGKHWVKWVLLFVTVISTVPLLVMPDQALTIPFSLQLFSGFLKITAIFMLFLAPKQDS
ncbi:hypothetical protein OQX61_02490 [Pedobacter sp. PLR]|uniref:hypothetical protein n=1 Tax=Pedobacter sp. PLR TaxID=2994465 RepID=UPI00224680C9|nr:hypothetical protein [Pedobacter sp. PLR]MCX2450129.1 hypothetical protein [Pedobacter sp. PLR]